MDDHRNAGRKKETPAASENKGLRLQVYLANCGLGSRRKCEEYITNGEVKINNKTILKLGEKVFDGDIVTYKGKDLHQTQKKLYLAFNKPSKILCSNSDPDGRILLLSFFKEFTSFRLFSIGRLDYMSSGLILMTNDGDFGKKVSHPSTEIEKEYLVEAGDKIEKNILDNLLKGVIIEGEQYKIKKYLYKTPYKISLILVEGKNREIRNIFSFYRIKIKKLQRIRIGCIKLENLFPGTYRNLTEKEINWFKTYRSTT